MTDLRKRLGLDLSLTYITWRRLQFLGRQLRLPDDRLDRAILWLAPSEEYVAARRLGHARFNMRQVLWRVVEGVLAFSGIPRDQWRASWVSAAKNRL
eukprot:8493190-Pyramimonas_sp.AAC.1